MIYVSYFFAFLIQLESLSLSVKVMEYDIHVCDCNYIIEKRFMALKLKAIKCWSVLMLIILFSGILNNKMSALFTYIKLFGLFSKTFSSTNLNVLCK